MTNERKKKKKKLINYYYYDCYNQFAREKYNSYRLQDKQASKQASKQAKYPFDFGVTLIKMNGKNKRRRKSRECSLQQDTQCWEKKMKNIYSDYLSIYLPIYPHTYISKTLFKITWNEFKSKKKKKRNEEERKRRFFLKKIYIIIK